MRNERVNKGKERIVKGKERIDERAKKVAWIKINKEISLQGK